MPVTKCPHCFGDHHWSWEDAFLKFGFGDSDGVVMTETVADILRKGGYAVECHTWGFHNTVIVSIRQGIVELLPQDGIRFGHDDPRDYLPEAIVSLLDDNFNDNAEVAA